MARRDDFESITHESVVVLDTNVLLTDPNLIFAYGDAEIILPETVLSEIDKLKTSRADNDLKFKGREITRILFELGDGVNLLDGVDLPNGGRLRVVNFENNPQKLPQGLSLKQSDDKILATAYQLYTELGPDCDNLKLITNDLNMLLKAQNYGICVMRYGGGDDVSWLKRYIVRPFMRYRVPVIILTIALAIFLAVVAMVYTYDWRAARSSSIPSEFRELLTADQRNAFDALNNLQDNPADASSLLTLGNFYSSRASQSQLAGDNAQMITYAKVAIRYYDKYLSYTPKDSDARTDFAIQYFQTGDTDRAIQEAAKVLEDNPKHMKANYNLGIFYYFGRRDLDSAENQFKKVIELGATDTTGTNHAVAEQAKVWLRQIQDERNGISSSQEPSTAQ